LICQQTVNKLLEAGQFSFCLGLRLFDQGVVTGAAAQEGHRVDHVGHSTGRTSLVIAVVISPEFLLII